MAYICIIRVQKPSVDVAVVRAHGTRTCMNYMTRRLNRL
jgi:hypothetical protein